MTKLGRPSVWDQHGEEWQRLYEQESLSRGQIAKQYSTSVQSVTRVLTRRGVVFDNRLGAPRPQRSAEEQAAINAKISASKVGVPLGPRRPPEYRTCENQACPLPDRRFEYRPGKTGERFCSRQCRTDVLAAEQKAGAQAEYELDPKLCPCGKPIPFEYRHTRQFHAHECRVKYGAKRQADPANTLTGICENPDCPLPERRFTYPKNQGHRRYCSNRCSQEHTRPNEQLNGLEGMFYNLASFLGLGVRRPEGSEQIPYGTRGSYAPDFIVTWRGESCGVETKAEPWVKANTEEKHRLWRAAHGHLVVLYRGDVDSLRLASDADSLWYTLEALAIDQEA